MKNPTMPIKALLLVITATRRVVRALCVAVLVLIITTPSVLAASRAPQSFVRKAVVATELPLYKLLHCIDSNIKTQLRDAMEAEGSHKDESQKTLLSALSLSETGLELVTSIVDDFNNGTAPLNREIEHKFMKICMLNKDVESESTKQRHLRELIKHIKSFNHYITVFCLNRKNFLKPSDKDFFNRVTQLNHILLYGVLNEDYIDINLLDRAADLLVYRPLEFMAQHKVITAIVITAIVVCLGYYYINRNKNPRYKEFDIILENQQHADVIYSDTLEQVGANCGAHGCVNAVAMSFGNNVQEKKELVGRIKQHPEIFNDAENYILTKKRETFNAFVQKCNNNVNDHDINTAKDIFAICSPGDLNGESQVNEKQFFDTLNNVEETATCMIIVRDHKDEVKKVEQGIQKYEKVISENGEEERRLKAQGIKNRLEKQKIALEKSHTTATKFLENNPLQKVLTSKKVVLDEIKQKAQSLKKKYAITTQWMQQEDFTPFLSDNEFITTIKNGLGNYDDKGSVKVTQRQSKPICIFDSGHLSLNQINAQSIINMPNIKEDIERFRKSNQNHSNLVVHMPGHWFAVSLEKDQNGKPIAIVADSFGAGQGKKAPGFEVRQALELYNNEQRLEIRDEIDELSYERFQRIQNTLNNDVEPQKEEDKLPWQPMNRGPRMLGMLADVCANLSTNGKEVAQNIGCQNAFALIKQFCNENGLWQVDVPLAGPNGVNDEHTQKSTMVFDIANSEYLAFIEWVGNNNMVVDN